MQNVLLFVSAAANSDVDTFILQFLRIIYVHNHLLLVRRGQRCVFARCGKGSHLEHLVCDPVGVVTSERPHH